MIVNVDVLIMFVCLFSLESGSTRGSVSTKLGSEITDASVFKFDSRHDGKRSKTQQEPEDHLSSHRIKQMLELLCDESVSKFSKDFLSKFFVPKLFTYTPSRY